MVKMRPPEDPLVSFVRGSYRLIILSLLESSVMHGYQILKTLERITGQKPKISTLYSILKDMERNGFLASRMEETRRIYRLTEKGRKVLNEFRSRIGEGAFRILEVILTPRASSP
ncbi:MAG: PadR family transcriptional regulator [Candidatus Korarchaeota archaeon]|nr:PadR family transcriptional regulator [Candidatus Korarchaeota archaeon]